MKQWPKLWQNLRASGATDFVRSLPSYIAAATCGHTKEHYWQVTDTDIDKAILKITSEEPEAISEAANEGK